jgi:hypothetical protein
VEPGKNSLTFCAILAGVKMYVLGMVSVSLAAKKKSCILGDNGNLADTADMSLPLVLYLPSPN